MDGNGRWAKQRQLPRIAGHRAGVENVRALVQYCANVGIDVLTLFAFSSENWRRPPKEVSLLFELFVTVLEQEVDKLADNGVRLRVVGERAAFPKRLQRCIEESEAKTQDREKLTLVIAANYGGRWDIAQAAQKLAHQVEAGELRAQDISEENLTAHLSLADLPEPDLFIRSGGEKRISNYLLWQLAYTELYFTECLWPDFDTAEFEKALSSYQARERRFGMTSDQVRAKQTDSLATEA